MPLNAPAGQTLFLDSTILHYAFTDFPGATSQCIELLRRAEDRDLVACTTVPVLNDAVHKVMCSEAKERFGLPRAGLVNWLKSHPQETRKLSHAFELLQLVEAIPITLLPVDVVAFTEAQEIVRAHGLLASDALIVAIMHQQGVSDLATNDDDFDRVPGLTLWKPR